MTVKYRQRKVTILNPLLIPSKKLIMDVDLFDKCRKLIKDHKSEEALALLRFYRKKWKIK